MTAEALHGDRQVSASSSGGSSPDLGTAEGHEAPVSRMWPQSPPSLTQTSDSSCCVLLGSLQ